MRNQTALCLTWKKIKIIRQSFPTNKTLDVYCAWPHTLEGRLCRPPPRAGWLHSSVPWLRCSWKCPRMALCWFSAVRESLVLLRSEVLLNLLTQAEHSTGRKEAAILSGPIVWPPGLGNQTALWPGCRLPLRPLLVGPGWGGWGERGGLPSHGVYFVFPALQPHLFMAQGLR